MSYQELALFYDQFMKDAPYDEWVAFMENAFETYALTGNHIIDLGCGTGEISWRMAAKDYQVMALDNAENMLTIAAEKAHNKNLPIRFIHQDLRELEGLTDLDAAFSFCDVINYITEPDELKKVFTGVADALKPGGLFLFDVHSLTHVQNDLIDHTFALDEENCSYIWFCSSGEQPGEMYHDLTFFVRDDENQGKDTYYRFDESHHQHTYSVAFYTSLLEECGFEVKKVCGDFLLEKEVTDTTERVFFIAKKL